MSELNIWMEAFELLEYQIMDEYVGPGKVNFIKIYNNGVTYRLYFDRKSSEVISLFSDSSPSIEELKTSKNIFYNTHREIFRCVKLNSLIS